MADITFFIRFSIELLTIVSFTVLLSFYLYQRKKFPSDNIYFLIAVLFGLIGMVGYTFDTIFNEWINIRRSYGFDETIADVRVIIFSLNVHNFSFSLFFIFLFLHYTRITKIKRNKLIFGFGVAIILYEIIMFILYSTNLYASFTTPLVETFPNSAISKFFANDFVFPFPMTEREYLHIAGRVVTMLSHSEQILGIMMSFAILFVIRKDQKSPNPVKNSSVLDYYAFSTLLISQILFLYDNLVATFTFAQLLEYNKNANVQTLAVLFVFVGLLGFIAINLFIIPPGVLKPEMQYGYEDYKQLKLVFTSQDITPTKNELPEINHNSILILQYLLINENVSINISDINKRFKLNKEVIKTQLTNLRKSNLIEYSDDHKTNLNLTEEGRNYLKSYFASLAFYFESALFNEKRDLTLPIISKGSLNILSIENIVKITPYIYIAFLITATTAIIFG